MRITPTKSAIKLMELHNTIALVNNTVLKSIANCHRFCKSQFDTKEFWSKYVIKNCHRTRVLMKASGKKILYANCKAFIKATFSFNFESFYNLFFYQLPLHRVELVALQSITAHTKNCRGLAFWVVNKKILTCKLWINNRNTLVNNFYTRTVMHNCLRGTWQFRQWL